jgi:hypothetical protein
MAASSVCMASIILFGHCDSKLILMITHMHRSPSLSGSPGHLYAYIFAIPLRPKIILSPSLEQASI